TEVAVILLGGIVTSRSIKVAGNNLDDSITAYGSKTYNLMIGDRKAEKIKTEIGGATAVEKQEMDIRDRNVLTGLPETMTITSNEITSELSESVEKIVHAVNAKLEKTPPELSADVMNRGIVILGGGALLKNMDKVISDETGIPVFIADNQLQSVAEGTGKSLDYIQHFKNQPNVTVRTTME